MYRLAFTILLFFSWSLKILVIKQKLNVNSIQYASHPIRLNTRSKYFLNLCCVAKYEIYYNLVELGFADLSLIAWWLILHDTFKYTSHLFIDVGGKCFCSCRNNLIIFLILELIYISCSIWQAWILFLIILASERNHSKLLIIFYWI